MSADIPEKDWKTMRKFHDELLTTLFLRINSKSKMILDDLALSPSEKYRNLYTHIKNSDKIIAECFDDWRRSKMFSQIMALIKHSLLKDSHFEELTEETQNKIKSFLGV